MTQTITARLVGAVVLSVLVSGGAPALAAAGAVNAVPEPPPRSAAPPSFAEIVARVAPAVVSIDITGKAEPQAARMPQLPPGFDPFGDDSSDGLGRFFGSPEARPGPLRASGSGFFVSPDGYIVTNNHVVEHADDIKVRTNDGRTLKARLIGRDPATDLAVIKVEGASFPYVSFEDRSKPRVGDWVVAVGNPFNLGGTATAGIVSAVGRPNVSGSSYVDYLQIDAPINRGNSGGPSFDLEGRVVGVNSAIFSPSGGSVGIGFAIPADVAARVAKQLISSGKVTRGYLGAEVQEITPEIAASLGMKDGHGALVASVTPGGPGQRSGLRTGDVIVRLNGTPIDSSADLTRQVAAITPGAVMRFDVQRAGRLLRLTATAGLRPSEQTLAQNDGGAGVPQSEGGELGLAVSPRPGGGVTVQGVAADSDAASKGIRPGDAIVEANGEQVQTPEDLRAAVAVAKREHRGSVLLLVARDGRQLFVPLAIKAG